ncbi:MAG: hypothetical protein KDE15_08710 [Erythrobacter sp.]|nr:hypothetical protein [Erythrobacter sp.]
MKAISAAAASLLVSSLFAAPAQAQYQRGGRACLEELCLGDGLAELSAITWDTARGYGDGPAGTRSVSPQETGRMERRYRGDITGLVGYFADSKFDNGALARMGNVIAACEHQYQTGTYTTASGNLTTVTVAMQSDPNTPADQRWTVTGITRALPTGMTPAQATEARATLEARYGDFTIRGRQRSGFGDLFTINQGAYTLRAPTMQNESYVLSQHPACSGRTGPVSID